MNQCLRVILTCEKPNDALAEFIQKHARDLGIEGTVQVVDPTQAKIVVCGSREKIDEFLDILHKGSKTIEPDTIEIEPFIKEKDYRGVFRIIE